MNDYEIADREADLQIDGGYEMLSNKDSFQHWKPLLGAWINSIKKFCSETKDQPPYIDNEMGNVGLLMSAAWQVEGIAVCEKLVQLKDHNYKLRLDLWMKLSECGIEELIEAKHTNHLEKLKRNKEKDKYDYEELKKEVMERCKKLKIKDNQRAVAIVFLTRNIKKYEPKNKPNLNVEEKIKCLLNEEYVRDDWDILAWCFPNEMRNEEFPGVILSAKHVAVP